MLHALLVLFACGSAEPQPEAPPAETEAPEVEPEPEALPASSLEVTLSGGLPATGLQVTCGEVEKKVAIRGGRARVDKLPLDTDCTLGFAGGPDVTFEGARTGAQYTCELSDTQAACQSS